MVKSLFRKILNKDNYQFSKKLPIRANSKNFFSQCGEDILIQYIFRLRGIDKPSYIDIGAHHPFNLSNTALLYEHGGRGINIEANPLLLENFELYRPEDQNLNIGIGPYECELDFFIMNDPSLSSFSKEEIVKITSSGKYKIIQTEKVRVTTVQKILQQYWNNNFPDLLNIDVEGMDFEILKSIDFNQSHPKVICVEAAEYSPIGAGKRRDDLISFLESKGYYEYANTNLNAIMVKRDFWFI